MEFTTKTTVRDYVAAYRLRLKPLLTILNAVFFVLIVLILYLSVIVFIYDPGSQWKYFFVFMFLCLLGFKICIPYLMGRIYRSRTSQQGEMVNELTPKGVSKKSSEGSLLYFPWSVCRCWRESRKVIIVVAEFGVCLVYPKACLSAAQQDELRGILAAALPKK
jgi:hypothetical protein